MRSELKPRYIRLKRYPGITNWGVDFEKMLQNASLLAIVAVRTAENEPSEVGRQLGQSAPKEGHLVVGGR